MALATVETDMCAHERETRQGVIEIRVIPRRSVMTLEAIGREVRSLVLAIVIGSVARDAVALAGGMVPQLVPGTDVAPFTPDLIVRAQ